MGVDSSLKALAEARHATEVIGGVRYVCADATALPLFESIWLIGRDESVARLRTAASV